MTTFEIVSSAGSSLGEYEADDAQSAIEAMWDDAQAAEDDRDASDLDVYALRRAIDSFGLVVLQEWQAPDGTRLAEVADDQERFVVVADRLKDLVRHHLAYGKTARRDAGEDWEANVYADWCTQANGSALAEECGCECRCTHYATQKVDSTWVCDDCASYYVDANGDVVCSREQDDKTCRHCDAKIQWGPIQTHGGPGGHNWTSGTCDCADRSWAQVEYGSDWKLEERSRG